MPSVSRSDRSTSLWQLFVCVLLIGVGLVAGVVEGVQNVVYALRHTTDEVGRYVMAGAAAVVNIGIVGLSVFSGMRFRAGKWVVGAVCFALETLLLAYSISNSVGFNVEQTIGHKRLVELQNQQAKDIAEEQRRAQREREAAITEFAKRTYMSARSKSKKAEAQALMEETIAAVTPLVPPTIATVMPDGKAELIGKYLGLDPETFRLLDSLYLSVLLSLVKWGFPTLAVSHWPDARRPTEVVDSEPKPQASSPAVTPSALLDVPTPDDLQLVKEWLGGAIHYDPKSTDKMQATDALHHYNEWQKQKDPTRRQMTLTKFGDCTTELGIEKEKDRLVYYIGLRPLDGAVAPPRTSTRGRRGRKMQHAPA